jgi:hypothetical protein
LGFVEACCLLAIDVDLTDERGLAGADAQRVGMERKEEADYYVGTVH